jgi:hypothetical protein
MLLSLNPMPVSCLTGGFVHLGDEGSNVEDVGGSCGSGGERSIELSNIILGNEVLDTAAYDGV